MGRAFFDHTGDVGVRLEAPSLDGLFRDAALALTETLTDLSLVTAATSQRVTLAAGNLDVLLVDWLDELLYLFEVRNLLVADARPSVREAGPEWHLDAEVRGEPFEAARHRLNVLIKGVTYHQLAVRRTDEGWATTVIFDI